jgi:predicted DNA-binding transcriptional regulator YafY
MRADRLVAILLLLQVEQRLTSRELAKRLEVSERTIHRDMEALSAAGVPIIADRGVGGGWRLLEEYRTKLTGLNANEARALFLGLPDTLLKDLGLEQAADSALVKVLAELPSFVRRNAESASQRIYIDPGGWRQSPDDVSHLPTLQAAVWQERKLLLEYERSDGTKVERLLDPLGLVAKGSLWYLIAASEGTPRTYRVSRVRRAELCAEPCTRPPDFDLASYWRESTAQFQANLPRYPAVLRVAPEILPRMRSESRYARIEEVGPPEHDGWMTVRIRFEVEHSACEYVLSYGTQIEVLEPPELRDLVVRSAQAIVEFYAQRG